MIRLAILLLYLVVQENALNFYPSSQVNLYGRIKNSRRGLLFELRFHEMEELFTKTHQAVTRTANLQLLTDEQLHTLEPYPTLVMNVRHRLELLDHVNREIESIGNTLPRVRQSSAGDCTIKYPFPIEREKVTYEESYNTLVRGLGPFKKVFNEFKADSYRDLANLTTQFPSYTMVVGFLNALDQRLQHFYSDLKAWGNDLTVLTRLHKISGNLAGHLLRDQCEDDSEADNDISYEVESCGYRAEEKSIICSLLRTSKTKPVKYTIYKAFVYETCAIDIEFVSRTAEGEKFAYNKDSSTVSPLISSTTSCLHHLENKHRTDIVENCPKTCRYETFEVTDYGIAFFGLSSLDRAQFPLYLNAEVDPPIFLSLSGNHSYRSSEGSIFEKIFISPFSSVVHPTLNFTNSELCPYDTTPQSWMEYYQSSAPASLTYLALTSLFFALGYGLKSLWTKPRCNFFRRTRPSQSRAHYKYSQPPVRHSQPPVPAGHAIDFVEARRDPTTHTDRLLLSTRQGTDRSPRDMVPPIELR